MVSITFQSRKFSSRQFLLLTVLSAGVVGLVFAPKPASAQIADAVTEMQSTMAALEGLAMSGLAVALTPLGIRVGLRIIWHVLASA
jgi:hypothetical protein